MDPLLLDLPTEFATQRLDLHCYRPGDGAIYFQAIRENRDHLYEFLPKDRLALQNEAEVEILIRQLDIEWQLRNLFIFGVWEKQSGAYVGETYLANADWHVPSIELGYFVLKEWTGKGIATEAARGILRYAFEHLQVIRAELQCKADNQASRRVAEHCGFQYEGCLRQHDRKKDGKVVDRLWFGLLLSEWQSQY